MTENKIKNSRELYRPISIWSWAQYHKIQSVVDPIKEGDLERLKIALTTEAAQDEDVLYFALRETFKRDVVFLDTVLAHAQKVIRPDFWQKGSDGETLLHETIDKVVRFDRDSCWPPKEPPLSLYKRTFTRIRRYVAAGCPIDVVNYLGKTIYETGQKDPVLKRFLIREFSRHGAELKRSPKMEEVNSNTIGPVATTLMGIGIVTLVLTQCRGIQPKEDKAEKSLPGEPIEEVVPPQTDAAAVQSETAIPKEADKTAPAQSVQSASVPQKISSRAKAPVFVAGLDFSRQRG